jgi:hypothetical protein
VTGNLFLPYVVANACSVASVAIHVSVAVAASVATCRRVSSVVLSYLFVLYLAVTDCGKLKILAIAFLPFA